jgi:hypothetical protein
MHWRKRDIIAPVIREAIESRAASLMGTSTGPTGLASGRAVFEERQALTNEIIDRLARDFTIVRRRKPQKTLS